MKKLIVILSIFYGFQCTLYAQLSINEVCSRNTMIINDEDGDFEDWIELFNASYSSVNLHGYSLSDDGTNISKWTFPNINVQPNSYLILFASGKDRKQTFDHWETIVYGDSTWKYFVPTSPVAMDWNTVLFNDSAWMTGSGGFGYGDGDDNTILSNPISSVFIRKIFTINDTSLLASVAFHIDYDDGFIAYVNGVEIARSNVGVTGNPAPFDELAYDEHEALFYRGKLPQEWLYSEQDAKTVLRNGTNVLAIQIHNVSQTSSDMTAIPFLTVAIKDNSQNYGTPPTWFKKRASLLHTNFKLSGDGETVYLSNPSVTIIDSLSYVAMQNDNSFGKFPDGSLNTNLFGKPTPDSTNNYSTPYSGYVSEPIINLAAGFFDESQLVTISATFPGSLIHFTLDGSPPTKDSEIYTSALQINYTRVIRARAFTTTELPSTIATNSYFINHPTTLPIFSISTHPDNFWDWEKGIYVKGPNAEPDVPYFNANFWQDWEIPVHIEYFNPDGNIQFEQDFGAKIHGGWSRSNDLKSLRILAKSKYGKSSLDYQLFPDKEIFSIKEFVLRNSGNETNVTHFRDALMHKAVHKTTHIDIQDYKPSVVFVNGEFLGVLNIREKISNDYLAENYGVDPDSVDLLQFDGYVIDGSNEHFLDMASFIVENDMAFQENYDNVCARLDIENFCDYFIAQTYYVNWDWPQNNVKYWREQKPNAKWRYIMTDVDMGLGLFGSSFSTNDLKRVINAENNYHSFMFKSLLKNQVFREYFINRCADLINTIFLPENLKSLAYSFRDSIAGEMPAQFEKWGGSMDEWLNWNIDAVLINFIENRAAFARDQVQEQFSLNKQVAVSLNVYPPGAGKIEISTITPEEYPWSGIYFDGVPVIMTAIPNPGYQFSFWQSVLLVPSPDFEPSLVLNIDTSDAFTAYFFGSPDTMRIIISEINYKSSSASDASDWVELYNGGNTSTDLSGWVFKDSANSNAYVIPQGTILAKNQHLVLFMDSAKFSAVFPSVTNKTGPFDFGLSSSGEWLRLYNEKGDLHFGMTYNSTTQWPVEPNGMGKTLEILDHLGDADDPMNWFAGCSGGSPGKAFEPCNMAVEETKNDFSAMLIFPNPSTKNVNIAFSLDKPGKVTIRLIDQQGRTIKTLCSEPLFAGNHVLSFDIRDIQSGIYLCKLDCNERQETRLIRVIH